MSFPYVSYSVSYTHLNTDSVNYAFASAQSQAMQYRHEFITPEHLLSALLKQGPFQKALAEFLSLIHI